MQGWAWQGLHPSNCLPCPDTETEKDQNTNSTLKYSNRAVIRLGCALPTY